MCPGCCDEVRVEPDLAGMPRVIAWRIGSVLISHSETS
jgi:hypothetical protein